MKNITLALDEKVLLRARKVAAQRGESLNALIRNFLERLCGVESGNVHKEMESWLEDTFKLADKTVKPKNIKWTRDELHRE
jgi:hypothetical protein